MKLSSNQDDSTDINITPLIDVVFLLLIFFMVSTTFSQHSEIQIELPEANNEKEEKRQDILDLAIDAKGLYYLNGRQLVNTGLKTLKQALLKEIAGKKKLPVVISADAKTPHQAVITAMDAAQQVGLYRLTFATAPVDPE
ncbi:MAG: biopolymer transporter ExbD [Gammaproteobacteria bacterium]|nr:biopolymer transporter ExbD [Gammaproteobacteria bacterium]